MFPRLAPMALHSPRDGGEETVMEEEYIKERLENQIGWYDAKSVGNKRLYLGLRFCELLLATLIPVLSSFLVGPVCLKLIIALLGAAVAVMGGLQGIGNYHENWKIYRAAAEILKRELSHYKTKTGPYREQENPFPCLVERCEGILSNENALWEEQCFGKQTKSR